MQGKLGKGLSPHKARWLWLEWVDESKGWLWLEWVDESKGWVGFAHDPT
jgi:hypothetical protein